MRVPKRVPKLPWGRSSRATTPGMADSTARLLLRPPLSFAPTSHAPLASTRPPPLR